jgi:hypothetical protein
MTNYEYRGNRRSGRYTLLQGVDVRGSELPRLLLDLGDIRYKRSLYYTVQLREHQRRIGRTILKGVHENIFRVYDETV